MESKICKIVYFDEDSVTDYVQIVAGGKLEKTTELLKIRDVKEKQEAGASAKIGINGLFKALFGWEANVSADVSAELSFDSNKMMKNIVKNTILTDFITILENDGNMAQGKSSIPAGTIKKFKNYKIHAVKDSLSNIVMVSPYLSMLKSGSSIPAGEYNIAIDRLDNALRHAKGYYEFVGEKANSRVVLRFNINSFKNGYTISDLLKMNLSVYAIKVGQTTLEMLNVNKELGMNISVMSKDNPDYVEEDTSNDNSLEKRPLNVFDVLLAGVETDD